MTDEPKCILLIDDDEPLCSTLSIRLNAEGYRVDVANDGVQGVAKARHESHDLILLDVMLPERSGWDVCRDIRQIGITAPILFLTARRQEDEKITGLKLGADDYITKPFSTGELMARIEVQLRRAPIRKAHGIHRFGPFEIDTSRSEVTRDGKPVHLARREYQLLRYLIERPNTNISRAELLQAVWGYVTTTTRTVDMHISTLREKLESNPKHPELILTVEGLGYRVAGSTNGQRLKLWHSG